MFEVTKVTEHGNLVFATKGIQCTTYNKEALTRSWLTMTNDSFYNFYGFNWVPPLEMQNGVRKTL